MSVLTNAHNPPDFLNDFCFLGILMNSYPSMKIMSFLSSLVSETRNISYLWTRGVNSGNFEHLLRPKNIQ